LIFRIEEEEEAELEQKMFHGGGDAAIRVAVTQVWHKPQEKPDCKSGKEEGGGLAHN